MKALIRAIIAAGVLLGFAMGTSGCTSKWHDTEWVGGTDLDMFKQIEADIKYVKTWNRNLRVRLISPGGPAVLCLEMARMIRDASDKGTVIEIHGQAVVASCGTFLLAAGTPGKRFVTPTTTFLVHGLQQSSFSGSGCVEWSKEPKTEDEKIVASLYDTMSTSYARYTGKSYAVTSEWVKCGNEAVGADKAVAMGIADQVER
jgi:ATP-dependent protease ClpP protease subunit